MKRDSMTPRERWEAVLSRQIPDRVPLDYRATEEATDRLMRYLGATSTESLFARLHVDRTASVGPRYVGPPVPADSDAFGCRYRNVDYGSGVYRECVYHPLARCDSVEAIEKDYSWPKHDWWDYSGIRDAAKGFEDRPLFGGGSEPFLTYKYLRGEMQAFMDLIENAEMVHYCLDRLYALCYERTLRTYEQIPGRVLLTGVAEDLGCQDGLLYSPEHIREFMLPRMKRMADLAHSAGALVLCHSDGAIRPIIPDLIAIGVDVLDPIQWRCSGMAREGLKRDFGGRLVFHGGMDNQYTLAFGSVDEVRQEVIDNLRILGEGGGYILGPCHNIQSVSPPENIVAMYDTAYEEGWT